MHGHGNHRRGRRSLEDAGAAGLMEGEGWRGARGRGPFGSGGPRRGGRARRGDVRAAILALLGEVAEAAATRSSRSSRPAATVSGAPVRDRSTRRSSCSRTRGSVSASEVDGKRVFQLTDTGRERLSDAGPDAVSPLDAVARETPEDLGRLRENIHQLMHATHQVGHAGTRAQAERAVEECSPRHGARIYADPRRGRGEERR